MKSYRNILFRCDGSPEIGLGHIVRCMALAEELEEQHSCNIVFAVRKSELAIDIVKKRFPVYVSNETSINYEIWLSKCIEQNSIEVLVLDVRDNTDGTTLENLKQKYNLLIVDIDDPEDKRLSADKVFYPPVQQVKEMDWSQFKGDLYSGWEYVILRSIFNHKYPRPKNKIPNILLAMGATDPSDMTQFTLRAMNSIEFRFTVTILLGAGYASTHQLFELLKSVQFQYAVFQDPPNIIEPMGKADFAIISFGQTAYELAALSVPAIYLCHSNDHVKSSELFVNQGIGISLGKFSKLTQQKLIEAVSFCLTEKNQLKEMAERASFLKISNIRKVSSIILGQNE